MNIEEILQHRHGLGLTRAQTATAVGVSTGTVSHILERASAAGLSWPLPDGLDDETLRARLYPSVARDAGCVQPDWEAVLAELGRKRKRRRTRVTRRQLWVEYRDEAQAQGAAPYSYSRFCALLAERLDGEGRKTQMHFDYEPGLWGLSDFSGKTLALRTGRGETDVEIFVAVLAHSQMIYAEAVPDQSVRHWTMVHRRAVEYFGGVPSRWIPGDVPRNIIRKDVRRFAANSPPLGLVVLPGVAVECDWRRARYLIDELGELVHLGVGERIHRVDDDGVRAPLRAAPSCTQHMVDDGNEEAERLSGPRAGRHHVALALRGERDGLLLMLVERQRLTLRPEDVGAAGVEDAAFNQGTDIRRALVARVDLDERLGPVAISGVDALDLLADVRSVDRRERRREALVLSDDAVAEGEYVECRCAACACTVRAR